MVFRFDAISPKAIAAQDFTAQHSFHQNDKHSSESPSPFSIFYVGATRWGGLISLRLKPIDFGLSTGSAGDN
jgi:hypothetical protein